ncbi:nucleotidyltransferase domain-containing protein [bacterium]|nr:MAG: nucleotidyltransferase domain-containing protein [bacterium]
MKIDIDRISKELFNNIPEAEFAYIFGSTQDGNVGKNSDIDIAFYFSKNIEISENLILEIFKSFEKIYPNLTLDICNLNTASLILRFEALRGTLLFVRDNFKDKFAEFFSLTAREYEDEMYRRKLQLKYRGY